MTIILKLDKDGAIPLPLSRALAGRRIDLLADERDGVHPVQALASGWRGVQKTLEGTIRELLRFEPYVGVNKRQSGEQLLDCYKDMIFRCTELFDVYSNLLISRLRHNRGKSELREISSYAAACKRMRDPVAALCNALKHGSRQLILTTAANPGTTLGNVGYMVHRFHGGNALLKDKDIHSKESSFPFRRKLHEIMHSMLRVDANAAELIARLPDNQLDVINFPQLYFNITQEIGEIVDFPVPTVFGEAHVFDGIERGPGFIGLVRMQSQIIIEPTVRTATTAGDGVTTTFEFQ